MQLQKVIRFGETPVGDGQPCFIVFEAGATHNGFENALRLVDHAAQAGADAIKFQKFDPYQLFADMDLVFPYTVLKNRETGETEVVQEKHLDQRKRMDFSHEEWRALKKHCDKRGILFFATVGDIEAVDLMAELGASCLKVCSGDINHFPLIEYICRTVPQASLQLDIGSATLAEVEQAVDLALSLGQDRISINHCPTGYPANAENVNLNILGTLKRVFDCPVAFSDHSPGVEMDVAALCLGANILEKTITLDRTTRSPEHIMSLEPDEFAGFVHSIRTVEAARGVVRRHLGPQEREYRKKSRRGIYAARAIKQGDVLTEADVTFKRPQALLGPDQTGLVLGRTARQDIAANAPIDPALLG